MSYLFPKGPNSRLKIYKVAVSTPEDKILQNTSDFNYEVDLPYAITDVVGMSLVEWSFPRDVIPSFYPTTTKLTGNNKLDFRLENPDIAGVPADFSVTFPTKFLAYQLPGDPTAAYLNVTETLMNEAISQNVLWKDRVYVSLEPQATNTTVMIVATTDPTLPSTSSTTLTLLFASGPNTVESANEVMGFVPKADYVSSSTLFYLNNGSQVIESPLPVSLRAAKYIDVFVKQSNLKPLQRVFVRDDNYTTNAFSTEGVNRMTINTDNPPRRIDKLQISLRYQGEGDPGDFLTTPILIPHALTFHIISLVDENHAIPTYVQQSLTY